MRQRRCADWLHDESGAVTVDWVVLTAALVGLGLAVVTLIATGINDPVQGIGAFLAGIEIKHEFD